MPWREIATILMLAIIWYAIYINNKHLAKLVAQSLEPELDEMIIAVRKTSNGYRCVHHDTIVNADYAYKKRVESVFTDIDSLIVFIKQFYGIVDPEPLFNRLGIEDRDLIKNIYKKYD